MDTIEELLDQYFWGELEDWFEEDDDDEGDISCQPERVKQDLVEENNNSDKDNIRRFELLFGDKYQTIRDFDKCYGLETSAKEKNIIVKLPVKDALLDTYCKRMIKHQVETSTYNHMDHKRIDRKRYVTPSTLYKDKLISTGRFSDWKRFIPESIIAEALGIKREYVVDINGVLTKPILVLIILMYIIDDTEDYECDYLNDEINLAEKVLKLYKSGKETCSLKKK